MKQQHPATWITGLMGFSLSVLFVVSCVSTSSTSGTSGTRMRHINWWNFYARGVGQTRDNQLDAAKESFETALGIRRGATFPYKHDHWRVRTYGMHFVEHYFPNRELGIIHYKRGEYAEAEKFLATSLKQTPTARAKYYLNRTREERLKDLAGIAPPRITVSAPEDEPMYTRKRTETIQGRVAAEGHVAEVNINNERLFIELAEKEYAFGKPVALDEGGNRITIRAKDLKGQETSKTLDIIADWTPPRVMIRTAQQDGNSWELGILCTDDTGIKEISLDGQTLQAGAKGNYPKKAPWQISITEDMPGVLKVVDVADNELISHLSPDSLLSTKWEHLRNSLAANDNNALSVPSKNVSQDTLKPRIRLSHQGGVSQVFEEEFHLDGRAQDGSGIAHIRINGEELLRPEDRGALQAYFSRRLPLEPGTNHFEVAVTDINGNESAKNITLIRVNPARHNLEYRLSIGVTPLQSEGSSFMARRSKMIIVSEFVRDPARFRLLERDEGWDYILQEQKISLSELGDPRTALKISKVLPAELMMMGGLISEAEGTTVYMKIVETEHGEAMFIDDVYMPNDQSDLEYLLSGLVLKVEQRFPMISGKVVKRTNGKCEISVGQNAGVYPEMRFIAVPENMPGTVYRSGDRVIELIARRVKQESATAVMYPDKNAEIQEGDMIYTR